MEAWTAVSGLIKRTESQLYIRTTSERASLVVRGVAGKQTTPQSFDNNDFSNKTNYLFSHQLIACIYHSGVICKLRRNQIPAAHSLYSSSSRDQQNGLQFTKQ